MLIYRTLLLTFGLTATVARTVQGTACTERNTVVRKEWSSMLAEERKSYIKAVQCLQKLPTILRREDVPGARSHYDDFTATHINYTWQVHDSAFFLGWHRKFLRIYEVTLRDACNYHGGQPYMDWPKYIDALNSSALFDGSDTSLGSDGTYDANAPSIAGVPRGYGGGCVTRGPFANLTSVFARNFTTEDAHAGRPPPSPKFKYSPDCLKRDLNNAVLRDNCNKGNISKLLHSPTIADFQQKLPSAFMPGNFGAHNGGHASVGGQMLDMFISPSDPAFYLHHAQIDRLWYMWQQKHPDQVYSISGTRTAQDQPASGNATLNDVVHFGSLAMPQRLQDIVAYGKHGLCYRYEH